MMLQFRIAISVLAALASVAAPAQERDILEMSLERPLDTTVNDARVRFGDPALENAEISLRDYLPRPWTASRIHAWYLAAYTRFGEAQKQAEVSTEDPYANGWTTFEWMALLEHLGAVLAASRDPRAALTLGRLIESPERTLLTCSLADNFMTYFGSDSSYQRPADEARGARYSSGCGNASDDVHKWWLLNQSEVERRAAAMTASLPPCKRCEQDALATIDQLRIRLRDSKPTLHLTIQGGGVPRYVKVDFDILPTSGQSQGSSGETGSNPYGAPYTSPDFRLFIPGDLLGRSDMRFSGIVISPGYRSVPFSLDHINDGRVVPITLVPVATKTLTGTITFPSDSVPRPFALQANLQMSSGTAPSGVSGSRMTLLVNIADAIVDQDGRFTITVPDVTQDPVLNAPGNRYELKAQDNEWALAPNVIALDHRPEVPLNVVAAPRPGSHASINANPGREKP